MIMEKRKHICVGILAHVDAGKTTLSEAILYTAGNLRKFGRVDNGDAFLIHRDMWIFQQKWNVHYRY